MSTASPLPISTSLPKIVEALRRSGKLVLQAEPGAGKSTLLPLSLIDSDWLEGKKILMLEPRRVAAKSIAHYLAYQLGEEVGERVGYQIKNDRKVSKKTVLEIVTEGILTRRLQGDPEIGDIGLIIFDEFHERSIHADLSLMLALEIQQTLREDLKLLVMSATIDTGLVSRYMGGAELIECPGRVFPVSLQFMSESRSPLAQQVVAALRLVLSEERHGDTLVFLPGQADIKRCLSESKSVFGSNPELRFLSLYGGLTLALQEQALSPDPNGKRRVVFTTNIAETSLTIEGVTAVIDSGLEKTLVYDPSSDMTRLETSYISKASAEQRKGRAGRTQAGRCIRLWSEARHASLRDYQGEEILSADLSGLVLDLNIWGSVNFDDINWLTPPPKMHFLSAKMRLVALGLIAAEGARATSLGHKAAAVGLGPRLATMLLKAESSVEKGVACELAALLSDRDIFSRSRSIDILERMLALQDFKDDQRSALKNYSIEPVPIKLRLTNASVFKKTVGLSPSLTKFSLTQIQEVIGKLLLFAYPDRLAKRRSNKCGRYQLANGRGVFLFEDDPLFGAEWLLIADCDGQKTEGRIYRASAVSLDVILGCLEDEFVIQEQYVFDKNKQKITGRRVTQYGAIKIHSAAISEIPPDKFQECLIQVFQEMGLSVLNWTPKAEAWVARAHWLGQQLDSFPEISKAVLLESLESWLLPYIAEVKSLADLKKLNVYELVLGTLSWEEQQFLAREAPVEYCAPSNKILPIVYGSQQGPTVSVQLQEVFGELSSPKIAGGSVVLRFELLSPARRPIQTTSDLAHFWQNSYFEVAKEMRGRYPRHRWPDKPLLEKAGRSIKTRLPQKS